MRGKEDKKKEKKDGMRKEEKKEERKERVTSNLPIKHSFSENYFLLSYVSTSSGR